MDRKCKNHSNNFCYICGHVVLHFCEEGISILLWSQTRGPGKAIRSHIYCKTCIENLRDRRNNKRKSMPFGVPMVWRERKDHVTDCYFCIANLKGINGKNKHHVQYPNVRSAIKAVPMAYIFLFLSQMSPWNPVLIPNLLIPLIQLSVVHIGQKRITNQGL